MINKYYNKYNKYNKNNIIIYKLFKQNLKKNIVNVSHPNM